MESTGVSMVEKVFQQFGAKILHLAIACGMDPTSGSPFYQQQSSPDWEMVQSCRLVSKEWNNLISSMFRAAGKPLLIFDLIRQPKSQRTQLDAESVFNTLETVIKDLHRLHIPIDGESTISTELPPVKLALPSTIFYNDFRSRFSIYWEAFVGFLVEIDFDLPADSVMNFSQALQPIESLKTVKFTCTPHKHRKTGPVGCYSHTTGVHLHIIKSVLLAGKNVTSFTLYHCLQLKLRPQLLKLKLPSLVEFVDVPLVHNDSVAGQTTLETSSNALKHLILRSPPPPLTYLDGSSIHLFFLMKRNAPSLEFLEFSAYADQIGNVDLSRFSKLETTKPLRIEMKVRMHKLHTLKLTGACWEIAQMESYERVLPSLKHLKLVPIFRPAQIQPLYKSRSETVESLMLCCVEGIPVEMVRGFATNFPFLQKLIVVVVEFDESLQVSVCGFTSLKVLHVLCAPKTDKKRKRRWLTQAVTGIPVEDQNALLDEQASLSDITQRHEKSASLRDLKSLVEFKLLVKDELSSNQTDVSVMIRTTFYQMPMLKRVIFSVDTFKIDEYQKQKVRKENKHGLKIEWHYSHQFEEYYKLF